MGAITSAISTFQQSVSSARQKRRDKKQQQKQKDQSPQQPSRLGPSAQQQVEEGLLEEHLASSAPPTTTTTTTEPAQKKKEGEAAAAAAAAAAGVSTTSNLPLPLHQAPSPSPSAPASNMASDADYAAFLDKANQDPQEGAVSQSGKKAGEFKTRDEGVQVPPVLSSLEAYYVSDADEEFVPVGLKNSASSGKKLPDEETFKKMINHPDHAAQVQILDIVEWDPQGQYKNVVDAVREAGKGADVRVYRVQRDKTRVEYWVLTVTGSEVVGVKALAVES